MYVDHDLTLFKLCVRSLRTFEIEPIVVLSVRDPPLNDLDKEVSLHESISSQLTDGDTKSNEIHFNELVWIWDFPGETLTTHQLQLCTVINEKIKCGSNTHRRKRYALLNEVIHENDLDLLRMRVWVRVGEGEGKTELLQRRPGKSGREEERVIGQRDVETTLCDETERSVERNQLSFDAVPLDRQLEEFDGHLSIHFCQRLMRQQGKQLCTTNVSTRNSTCFLRDLDSLC